MEALRVRLSPALPMGQARPRAESGTAIVELALLLPIFAMLIWGSIDLGRTAQYQNRIHNAAREGAAIVQVSPTWVNTGCQGDRNAVDRARKQNAKLAGNSGFSVTVSKKDPSTGVLTRYTGCGSATNTAGSAMTIAPGDRVVVTVTADVSMSGPITGLALGRTLRLRRSVEVVVQG